MKKYLAISSLFLGSILASSAQASGNMYLTVTNSCSQYLCYHVGSAFNGSINKIQDVTSCKACGSDLCVRKGTAGEVLIKLQSSNNQAQLDIYNPKGRSEFAFVTAYGQRTSPECPGYNTCAVPIVASSRCALQSTPSKMWGGSTYHFYINYGPN